MGKNFINILKKAIITLLYFCGVFKIFQFFSKRRDLVPIVLYHRIQNSLYSKNGVSAYALRNLVVTTEAFRKQIRFLSRNYRVISLKEYMDRRRHSQSLRGCAIVTFDDGFKDVKDNALEILLKNSCPATVFIIAGSKERIYWKHELYTILDIAERKTCQISLSPEKIIQIDLTNDLARNKSLLILLGIMEGFLDIGKAAFLERLKEELGIKDNLLFSNLYLNDSDLEELLNANIEIGAHSLSHRDLTLLGKDAYIKEIGAAISYVRYLAHGQYVCFSFPFGKINNDLLEYMKTSGAIGALTGIEELNKKDEDIFSLKRLFIAGDDLPRFVYKISGAEMFFNKFKKGLSERYRNE